MTHGTASTRGHLASNGGLRGHSVGGVFPAIIFQKGNPHTGLTHHVKTPDGKEFGPFETYELAEYQAHIWLDSRNGLADAVKMLAVTATAWAVT